MSGTLAELIPARLATRFGVLVVAGTLVVHCLWSDVHAADRAVDTTPKAVAAPAPPKAKERAFVGTLPQNVQEMRDAILAAVHAGDISELKTAIEWNELRPDFGEAAGTDAIVFLKKISADGEGREVLAALANMLAMSPARTATGKDAENTAVFVWPYLAELPLESLKPGELVDLYRLMPPEAVKSMREKKKWTWWRLQISADGTWIAFKK